MVQANGITRYFESSVFDQPIQSEIHRSVTPAISCCALQFPRSPPSLRILPNHAKERRACFRDLTGKRSRSRIKGHLSHH